MKTRRLIVNADDFGWTRGITDGILRAHHEGIVTSASFLANQPASEYAIEQMRNAPKVGVGIHLNLCSGAPILPASQVPSLVGEDGNFRSVHEIVQRLVLGRISNREIESEFRAQIRWARERGVDISHADSHYHVHLYPGAVRAFQRALAKEGIRYIRSPLNWVSPATGFVPECHGGPAYRRLAVRTYMRLLKAAPLRGFASADYSLVPPAKYRNEIARLRDGWYLAFRHMPPGVFEFSCHPGLANGGYSESDNLRDRRDLELGILIDPEMKRVVQQEQIELINYVTLRTE